jgi:hypothetical protein
MFRRNRIVPTDAPQRVRGRPRVRGRIAPVPEGPEEHIVNAVVRARPEPQNIAQSWLNRWRSNRGVAVIDEPDPERPVSVPLIESQSSIATSVRGNDENSVRNVNLAEIDALRQQFYDSIAENRSRNTDVSYGNRLLAIQLSTGNYGYKTGGRVRKTGKALVHKDEFVLPVGVKPTKGQKKSVKILKSKSNKV